MPEHDGDQLNPCPLPNLDDDRPFEVPQSWTEAVTELQLEGPQWAPPPVPARILN